MVLGISKYYSHYNFQPNFMTTLATVVKYSLLLFLAISKVLTFLWHLKFYHRSKWEIVKKCNVLRMSDRRAK